MRAFSTQRRAPAPATGAGAKEPHRLSPRPRLPPRAHPCTAGTCASLSPARAPAARAARRRPADWAASPSGAAAPGCAGAPLRRRRRRRRAARGRTALPPWVPEEGLVPRPAWSPAAAGARCPPSPRGPAAPPRPCPPPPRAHAPRPRYWRRSPAGTRGDRGEEHKPAAGAGSAAARALEQAKKNGVACGPLLRRMDAASGIERESPRENGGPLRLRGRLYAQPRARRGHRGQRPGHSRCASTPVVHNKLPAAAAAGEGAKGEKKGGARADRLPLTRLGRAKEGDRKEADGTA